jgi:autotransporter-associated beta strand protein
MTLNGNSVVRVAEDVLFGSTNGGASGSGTLTINGGKFSMGTSGEKWMILGRDGSGDQTINIGSGTLSFNSNAKLKSAFTGTSGNYAINQTGGVVAFYSDTAGTVLGGSGHIDMNGFGGTGSTTYNLDGGNLIVPQIQATSTNGARVFNFGGGTLTFSGASGMNLGAGGVAKVKAGGAIIDSSNNNVTISTGLSNGTGGTTDGGVTKLGTGALTLSGTSSYTGATTVNAGSLVVSGLLGSGDYAGIIINNASLTFNNTDTQTLSGAISGGGSLNKGGSGTLVVSGNGSTASGTLNISSGTVKLGSATALGNMTIGSSASIIGTLDFNGYSVTNAFGDKAIQNGTLANSSANAVDLTGMAPITNSAGRTAYINATGQMTFGTIQGDTNGAIFTNIATGTGTVVYAGSVNNTNLALVANSGTIQLAKNGGYAARTVAVNGGTVQVTADGKQIDSSLTVSSGNFDFNGYTQTNLSITMSGGQLVNNGATAVTQTNIALTGAASVGGSGNMTVAFVSNNNNNVTKNGSGTVTMLTSASSGGNAANDLNVNSGVFVLSNTNAAVFNNATVAFGATLRMDPNSQVTSQASVFNYTFVGQVYSVMTINGTLDLNGAGGINNTARFFYGSGTVVNNRAGSSTLTFGLRDTGKTNQISIQDGANGGITAVNLYSSGYPANTSLIANFGGSNSYSGTTTIGDLATLQAGSTNAFSPNSVVTQSSRSSLDLNGYNNTIAGLSGSPTSGNNVMLGGATLTLNTKAASSLNFAGNIVDSGTGVGAVVMAGSGTQTLSGASTYAGSTIVNSGTLIAGNANAFGRGLLQVSGGTANLGGRTMTNALSLTGGNLTSGVLSNSTGSFDLQSGSVSATLAGAAGATKSGSGTVTLTGNNTYTGATTVNGGSLSLGATGSLSNTASVTVASGSTLLLGAADKVKSSAALSLGGTLSMGANDSTRAGSQTFSTLTLTGNSVIDFSALTGTSSITFGSINLNSYTLSIYNWNGTNLRGSSSTTGGEGSFTRLYDLGSFTGDVSKISFFSGAGTGFMGEGSFVGNEIVPVPEPGVIVAAFMLLGILLWSNRGTIAALATRRA